MTSLTTALSSMSTWNLCRCLLILLFYNWYDLPSGKEAIVISLRLKSLGCDYVLEARRRAMLARVSKDELGLVTDLQQSLSWLQASHCIPGQSHHCTLSFVKLHYLWQQWWLILILTGQLYIDVSFEVVSPEAKNVSWAHHSSGNSWQFGSNLRSVKIS